MGEELKDDTNMGFGMKEYPVDNTNEHPVRNSLFLLSGIALLLFATIIFVKEFVLVDTSSRFQYAKNNWKQINVSDDHLVLISKDGIIYNYRVSDDFVYDMDAPGWGDEFVIDKSGEFTIYSDIIWHKDTTCSSLLTGYVVTTKEGNVVYAWYGPDHTEQKIQLNEGNYILQRCYIGSDDDLRKFCTKCNFPYPEGKYQFPSDTEWRLTDSYGIKKE